MAIFRFLKITAFIILILQYIGCGEQVYSRGISNVNDSLNQEISKSIDDFLKRPIYKHLTAEIIDSTPDDKLLQIVFDNLVEKLPQDFTKYYETIFKFSKYRQAIYMIWCLEADVNNGGFNQYYFNSSNEFAQFTPDALRLVSANKFAELVERANKIYELENKKITQHQDGSLEGFSQSYQDNPLNEIDTEFYNLYKTEDLHKLEIEFIRKNKNEFVDN